MQANEPADTCDVCGRTILRGERSREYVNTDGERVVVCDLCRPRAEHAGWVRADSPEAGLPAATRERRRSGLGAWLRTRRDAKEPGEEPLASEPAVEERAAAPPDAGRRQQQQQQQQPAEVEDPARDPARPREPRHVRAVPSDPLARMEAAMARFNRSEHVRTVAGLIRTLGSPRVSAGSAAGMPAEVLLTVAWDLSWYQWSVDLSNEAAPVRPIAKGNEVGELDPSAQQWNARAEPDGTLHAGAGPSGG